MIYTGKFRLVLGQLSTGYCFVVFFILNKPSKNGSKDTYKGIFVIFATAGSEFLADASIVSSKLLECFVKYPIARTSKKQKHVYN